MSDFPQGPDWWQASDLKWYPPQPSTPPPAPATPPIGLSSPPDPSTRAAFEAPPAAPQAPWGQQPPAPGTGQPTAGPPTAGPAGAQAPWSGQPPAYPQAPQYGGAGNVTVKKKSKLPWVLGIFALVVLLGVGGCLALISATTSAIDEELSNNDATVITPDGSVVEPGSSGGGAGSQEDALPIGSEVDLGNGWRIKVNSADVSPGATALVEQANTFNEPPEPGKRYIIVNLSATLTSSENSEPKSPWLELDYAVFGSDGVERSSSDTFAVAPDPALDELAELMVGATATGNVVFAVGAEETDLMLRVEPMFSFDDTHTWIALG